MFSKSCQSIRLSESDISTLISSFKTHFLPNDHLWVFGSRTDLLKKGGDIDLYNETHAENAESAVQMELKFSLDLERALGEQKVDIVLNVIKFHQQLAIYQIAKENGVQLL